jgi:hypothetical protein
MIAGPGRPAAARPPRRPWGDIIGFVTVSRGTSRETVTRTNVLNAPNAEATDER